MILSKPTSLASRLIVALDVDSGDKARALVRQLAPLGVTFKVGMQLFYREGIPLVQALQAEGCEIFLDLKLHDIPNTVAKATESLVSQGVSFFNVHTQGGPEMMKAAVQAGKQAALQAGGSPPSIIGVTLLTSLSAQDVVETLKVQEAPAGYVLHLAQLAKASGLSGVVCSAQEASRIRAACGPNFLLVTPGIRPAGADLNDQARILTPQAALAAGSDYLVVGRPITAVPTPVEATQQILEEMALVEEPV